MSLIFQNSKRYIKCISHSFICFSYFWQNIQSGELAHILYGEMCELQMLLIYSPMKSRYCDSLMYLLSQLPCNAWCSSQLSACKARIQITFLTIVLYGWMEVIGPIKGLLPLEWCQCSAGLCNLWPTKLNTYSPPDAGCGFPDTF